MFRPVFNSFASTKHPALMVCLQEATLWRNHLPSFAGCTSFASSIANPCPRAAFYAWRSLIDMATMTQTFTSRSDYTALVISAPSLFSTKAEKFHPVNCCSVSGSTTTKWTVSLTLTLPSTAFPPVVVVDFNIHHPAADPIRRHSSSETECFLTVLLKGSWACISTWKHHKGTHPLLSSRIMQTLSPRPGVRVVSPNALLPRMDYWSAFHQLWSCRYHNHNRAPDQCTTTPGLKFGQTGPSYPWIAT